MTTATQLIPSATAEALVKHFEGLRLFAYTDSTGNETIGYGHKLTHLESYPNGITQQQAYDILLSDLDLAAKCIRSLVRVDLTQGQFDALCDFVFNEGCGHFAGSTMLQLLNAGEYQRAAAELSKWNKAGGEVSSWQVKRRQAELEVWQTGTFST